MKAIRANKSRSRAGEAKASDVRDKAKKGMAAQNEDEDLTLEELTNDHRHQLEMAAQLEARQRFRKTDNHNLLRVDPKMKVAFYSRCGAFYGMSTGAFTACVPPPQVLTTNPLDTRRRQHHHPRKVSMSVLTSHGETNHQTPPTSSHDVGGRGGRGMGTGGGGVTSSDGGAVTTTTTTTTKGISVSRPSTTGSVGLGGEGGGGIETGKFLGVKSSSQSSLGRNPGPTTAMSVASSNLLRALQRNSSFHHNPPPSHQQKHLATNHSFSNNTNIAAADNHNNSHQHSSTSVQNNSSISLRSGGLLSAPLSNNPILDGSSNLNNSSISKKSNSHDPSASDQQHHHSYSHLDDQPFPEITLDKRKSVAQLQLIYHRSLQNEAMAAVANASTSSVPTTTTKTTSTTIGTGQDRYGTLPLSEGSISDRSGGLGFSTSIENNPFAQGGGGTARKTNTTAIVADGVDKTGAPRFRQVQKPRVGFGFGGRAASAFRLRQRLSVAKIVDVPIDQQQHTESSGGGAGSLSLPEDNGPHNNDSIAMHTSGSLLLQPKPSTTTTAAVAPDDKGGEESHANNNDGESEDTTSQQQRPARKNKMVFLMNTDHDPPHPPTPLSQHSHSSLTLTARDAREDTTAPVVGGGKSAASAFHTTSSSLTPHSPNSNSSYKGGSAAVVDSPSAQNSNPLARCLQKRRGSYTQQQLHSHSTIESGAGERSVVFSEDKSIDMVNNVEHDGLFRMGTEEIRPRGDDDDDDDDDDDIFNTPVNGNPFVVPFAIPMVTVSSRSSNKRGGGGGRRNQNSASGTDDNYSNNSNSNSTAVPMTKNSTSLFEFVPTNQFEEDDNDVDAYVKQHQPNPLQNHQRDAFGEDVSKTNTQNNAHSPSAVDDLNQTKGPSTKGGDVNNNNGEGGGVFDHLTLRNGVYDHDEEEEGGLLHNNNKNTTSSGDVPLMKVSTVLSGMFGNAEISSSSSYQTDSSIKKQPTLAFPPQSTTSTKKKNMNCGVGGSTHINNRSPIDLGGSVGQDVVRRSSVASQEAAPKPLSTLDPLSISLSRRRSDQSGGVGAFGPNMGDSTASRSSAAGHHLQLPAADGGDFVHHQLGRKGGTTSQQNLKSRRRASSAATSQFSKFGGGGATTSRGRSGTTTTIGSSEGGGGGMDSLSSMSKIFRSTEGEGYTSRSTPHKRRKKKKASFVQRKLDRARRQKVPLGFVIAEMERRVDEERTLKDFSYYFIFLAMFIIYFVATRDIETNHYFAGWSKQVLTSKDLSQYDAIDQPWILESARRDTEWAYGSSSSAIHESVFVTTRVTNNESNGGGNAEGTNGISFENYDASSSPFGSPHYYNKPATPITSSTTTSSSFTSYTSKLSASSALKKRLFEASSTEYATTTTTTTTTSSSPEDEAASSDDIIPPISEYERLQYERIHSKLNLYHPGFLGVRHITDLANWIQYAFIPTYWNCANPTFRPPYISRMSGTTAAVASARITVKRVRRNSCVFSEVLGENVQSGEGTVAQSQSPSSTFLSSSSTTTNIDSSNDTNTSSSPSSPLAPSNDHNGPLFCYAATGYAGVPDSDLDKDPFCNITNPMMPSETLFQYEECEASYLRFTAKKGVYSCSGHVATMPFAASCDDANKLMKIMRPPISTETPPPSSSSSSGTSVTTSTSTSGDASSSGEPSPFDTTTNASQLNQDYTADTMWRDIYTYDSDSENCDSFLFGSGLRLVVIELYAYDNDADTFLQVRAIAEITAGGAVIPTFTTRIFRVWSVSTLPITIFEFFFFAFVLVFVKRLLSDWALNVRETGSYILFLTDIWNLLEAVNLVTFLVSIALRWSWWLSESYSVQYNIKTEFPFPLRILEHKYQLHIYAAAINLLLTFLKILKYLRISERLNILTKTIGYAQGALIGVLAILILVLSTFAIAAVRLYGSNMAAFANFNTAFSSLLFQIRGQSNYEEMRRISPLITYAFYLLFWLLSTLLVENFFVVVLSDGFAQISHQNALPPLSEQIARKFTKFRMFLTFGNLWERVVKISEGNDLTKLLHGISINLQEHRDLHLAAAGGVGGGNPKRQQLMAAAASVAAEERGEVGTSASASKAASASVLSTADPANDIGMYFRDLNWWVPRQILEQLGPYYLLLLWEDIVFTYLHQETCSLEYMQRETLHDSIEAGIEDYFQGKLPDFLALEVQADRLSGLLGKLPMALCEDDTERKQRRQRRQLLEAHRRKKAEKAAEKQSSSPRGKQRHDQASTTNKNKARMGPTLVSFGNGTSLHELARQRQASRSFGNSSRDGSSSHHPNHHHQQQPPSRGGSVLPRMGSGKRRFSTSFHYAHAGDDDK